MLCPVQLLALTTIVYGYPFELGINKNYNRILNGKNITIEERPYQVSISANDTYRCGGSILSPRWIVTAAHCIWDVGKVMIRAGSTYNDKGGLTFYSKRLIVHPKYNYTSHDFDVGLIDLGDVFIPLDGYTIADLRLSLSTTIMDGTIVYLAGWGFISSTGEKTDSLMQIDTKIYNWDACGDSYVDLITDRMICTMPSVKTGCIGDSGSPVVSNLTGEWVQVGIVSFGELDGVCTSTTMPMVLANVANSDIREWIRERTGF